jgi:hypothetical protein
MVVTSAPTHVEDTVQETARLRAEHDRGASPLQRTVERLTASAARDSWSFSLYSWSRGSD